MTAFGGGIALSASKSPIDECVIAAGIVVWDGMIQLTLGAIVQDELDRASVSTAGLHELGLRRLGACFAFIQGNVAEKIVSFVQVL